MDVGSREELDPTYTLYVMAGGMDRAALEERLAGIEAKIAGVQQQIDEQRRAIERLERAGQPADHAKNLLPRLELLHKAYEEERAEIRSQRSEIGHLTSGYAVTTRAWRAVAPSPRAWTISGLTSISTISGQVCIKRPRTSTACATASTSAGGAPRKPVSSLAARSRCSAATISSLLPPP